MKVAIVADWLTDRGGAEKVILAMHDVFPQAPIFTTLYNPEVMGPEFERLDIRTSFLQKWPFAKKHRTKFVNLLPMAIEDLDVSEYDVVISSSSAIGHGVITHANQLHICYCHTPMRFCWDDCQNFIRQSGFSKFVKKFIPLMLSPVRVWDYWASDRPDQYIANSNYIKKRIKKYFNQTADVLYPPVETNHFRIANAEEHKDFYLVVSRLVDFKKVDLAIEACNKLKIPLKVAGSGPAFDRYSGLAGPTVQLLGYVPEVEKEALMRECKALIFPQLEDFGITPLEVMASGKPVIAFRKGGALETVIEGKTGMFFDKQTPDSLAEAIQKFETMKFDPEVLQKHAKDFSYEVFCEKFKKYVEEKWVSKSSRT